MPKSSIEELVEAAVCSDVIASACSFIVGVAST